MLGRIRASTATIHRNEAAIISTRKTWCDLGTRPKRRLLAQPKADIIRSPANRPTIPKTETIVVIFLAPVPAEP